MPRKKKETLVHFDIDTLSKQPGQKEVPKPVSLGQTLKAKREKKKLSLEDVSKKLCIKDVYLKALEEGHYYAFPNRVYGIGFLRSYSKFLGLDSDLMVAEFHAETSDIKDAPLDMPVIEKHFALPSKKTLTIVALVVFVAIVVWFTAAALLTTDLSSKISFPLLEQQSTEETKVPAAPTITDEALPLTQTTKPTEEVKEHEISADALTAKVAFIAKNDVWVRLYNTETKKVILDKVLRKNDSFIPESQLSILELTTGRGNLLDLYKSGKKVKTFGQEKSRSLAEFAD
ncbi:MAG: helix-turn-helix domain-containing protein [Alphaproteobacteria bacterium]|nr:helix-turn-helix domain-containing protein [Alphaproteobacteria bacterium]